jgi:uncharacterized membrane protein
MRHPLHPALVHFPVACWSLAVVSDVTSVWLGEAAWRWSGGLLAVGCAMALAAMLAGMMELSRVPEGAPMRDPWTHMGAMLIAFTAFTARLLLRLDHLQPLAPDIISFALDAAGFLALAVGGWFDGRWFMVTALGVINRDCGADAKRRWREPETMRWLSCSAQSGVLTC